MRGDGPHLDARLVLVVDRERERDHAVLHVHVGLLRVFEQRLRGVAQGAAVKWHGGRVGAAVTWHGGRVARQSRSTAVTRRDGHVAHQSRGTPMPRDATVARRGGHALKEAAHLHDGHVAGGARVAEGGVARGGLLNGRVGVALGEQGRDDARVAVVRGELRPHGRRHAAQVKQGRPHAR
eukprot:44332-Prymnesium_polylepis.1